ncbi:MAG: bacterial Ig-like domain-containing protein [Bacilli bacterium]
MNKIIKKLFAPLAVFALALGVSISLNSQKDVVGAKAAPTTVTVVRDDFTGGSGYAEGTWSKGGISGAGVIYFTTTTNIQVSTTSGRQPYPHNTTATPGPITNISVTMPGTGSLRTLTPRVSSTDAVTSHTGGTALSAQTFTSNTQTLNWTIPSADNIRYFQLVPGGNTNWASFSFTYEEVVQEFGVLDHIKLDHSSAKKAFFVGETFSSTGLVVTAVDEDDNEMVVSEFTTNLDDHEFVAADKGSNNVVVTYQGKTADYNITVSEYVPGEGTVTLSVKNTTYIDSTWTSDDLNIVKSSPSVGDLTFSDIGNVRLNSKPVEGSISIGGNKTTGGSFKITLPALTYASAIKFNDLSVGSDATTPTLKINDKTSFTFASGMTSATLKPYDNVLVISTLGTSRIWTSSIEITLKTLESLPEDYATYFLDTTDAECALLDVKTTTWNSLQHVYGNLGASSKALLVVDSENETISAAMERYVFIATKYAYTDFMNVGVTSPFNQLNEFYESNSVLILVVVASIFGITAIAGFYFISKRRKVTE